MASYDDTATVSGSVVSIENGADDVPTKSLVVTIPPTLSGVSSVTETQTGKNLLDTANAETKTNNSVSITCDGSGKYTATGTATGGSANITFDLKTPCTIKSGMFLHLMNASANASVSVTLQKQDNTTIYAPALSPANRIADLSSYAGQTIYSIRFYVVNGASFEMTLTPMLCYSNTATTFEQYQTPTQYTASLGRTIYGGQVDIVNGVGESLCGKIVFDGSSDENWTAYANGNGYLIAVADMERGTWYTSEFAESSPLPKVPDNNSLGVRIGVNNNGIYVVQANTIQGVTDLASFKAWLSENPLTVIYPLDTSSDFTFDGQEINTRLGYNAFWSEQGDTELTYYKSGYGFTSVTVNKLQGKNLLENNIEDGSTGGISYSKNADGSISCVGTVSNVNATRLINTVTLPIGNYILSGADSSINLRAVLYDGTGTAVTNRNDTGNGVTISVDSTIAYIEFRIKARTASEVVNTIISPMLAVGSSVLPYEPYEAVSKTAYLHKVIYGGTADVIRGTCEPKNLIYPKYEGRTNAGITYTVNSDHSITCQGVASATSWAATNLSGTPEKMQLFPAGEYTVSGGVSSNVRVYCGGIYTDGTTPYLPHDTGSGATITLEKPAYLYPQIRIESGTDLTTPVTIYIQLEAGSSVSDYVPHFEPFTFPPISMETDEGENTLFANEGASAITYRKAVD